MAVKRIVDTKFWTDDKIVDEFSPEDRYFMLYLMTNPHTTQLGIYKFNKRIMAFELGYSVESVSVLIDRFCDKYKVIKISTDTSEIAILNYLRYSIVKGGKPVEDLLIREIGEVKNKALIKDVFEHIKDHKNLNATVLKIIQESGVINDNDNDNDNDNENEESHNESHHESLKPKKTAPIRHKYGEYKKVLLTDEQLQKLKLEFSDWQERIQRLDDYIASKGDSYKDHLATIRNWAKKDKEKHTLIKKQEPITSNPFLQRKLERMAAEKANGQERIE